jgi:Icc-related predicted phosphoesterase
MKPSMFEKDLYFILANGFRSLLVKTMQNNDGLTRYIETQVSTDTLYYLLIIMCMGILGSAWLLILTLRATLKIERGKQDIMKIFAMLSNEDIKRVYDLCDMYLDNFDGNQSEDQG